jgi:hypothetical protein
LRAINTQAVNAAVPTAKLEQVQDYEIGVKSDWPLARHSAAHQPGVV